MEHGALILVLAMSISAETSGEEVNPIGSIGTTIRTPEMEESLDREGNTAHTGYIGYMCEDILDHEECLRFKDQGLCTKSNDGKRDLTIFCQPTCGLCTKYIYLGEGECRDQDGSYGLGFSIGFSDLSPHTQPNGCQKAYAKCADLCNQYNWCFAVQVTCRDIWTTPKCGLMTDYKTFVDVYDNKLENNKWGGQQTIGENKYQTYCKGSGKKECSSDTTNFGAGGFFKRTGYHCYKKSSADA